MDAVAGKRTLGEVNHATLARIRQEAKRLARGQKTDGPDTLGVLAALAYPDRVALRRKGDSPRFVMSGGKGAIMPDGDPMASERLLVATDLDGDPREARIRQAVRLSDADLRATFPEQIGWHDVCTWSRREGRVLTRQQERFGALVLDDRAWSDASPDEIALAMLDGVRQLGLMPGKAAKLFLARARLMGSDFPDFSEPHLMETLEDWLLPHLSNVRSTADWKGFDLHPALLARLSWDEQQILDKAAPAHFTTPLGRKLAIDYDGAQPQISLRLQEVFGVTRHPDDCGPTAANYIAVPCPAPGSGDHRFAGFLDGIIRRCPQRHARPISAPPVARRPDPSRPDAQGETARHLVSDAGIKCAAINVLGGRGCRAP